MNGTTESPLEALTQRGANEAMRAAVEWCARNGKKADASKLAEELKARSSATWDSAFADFKAAAECGMGQIAVVTFLATFTLMGIEAAKAATAEGGAR